MLTDFQFFHCQIIQIATETFSGATKIVHLTLNVLLHYLVKYTRKCLKLPPQYTYISFSILFWRSNRLTVNRLCIFLEYRPFATICVWTTLLISLYVNARFHLQHVDRDAQRRTVRQRRQL